MEKLEELLATISPVDFDALTQVFIVKSFDIVP